METPICKSGHSSHGLHPKSRRLLRGSWNRIAASDKLSCSFSFFEAREAWRAAIWDVNFLLNSDELGTILVKLLVCHMATQQSPSRNPVTDRGECKLSSRLAVIAMLQLFVFTCPFPEISVPFSSELWTRRAKLWSIIRLALDHPNLPKRANRCCLNGGMCGVVNLTQGVKVSTLRLTLKKSMKLRPPRFASQWQTELRELQKLAVSEIVFVFHLHFARQSPPDLHKCLGCVETTKDVSICPQDPSGLCLKLS